MKALTGEHKSLEELLPTLPPGPDGNAPDPRAALTPPVQDAVHGVPSPARPLEAVRKLAFQDRVAARLSLAATRSGCLPAKGFWPRYRLTHFHAASLAERAFAFETRLMEFRSAIERNSIKATTCNSRQEMERNLLLELSK